VQRLRTLQGKKEAQAKASRRDIATLVEKGKIETARIKVEGIILEDIHVELLEILELYCELLLARFGVLDQNTREPDPAVSEGVCSIIHAAPRTELKELHVLRDILTHRYGRDFTVAVMENRDSCVSDRVVRKLTTATPSAELVNAYLAEITKAYGVSWTPPPSTNGGDGPEGGIKVCSKICSLLSSFSRSRSQISPRALIFSSLNLRLSRGANITTLHPGSCRKVRSRVARFQGRSCLCIPFTRAS
jgi:vacuolar protein sorting-associated protein IST1